MGWLPLYQDCSHTVLLRHELTGAIREAPWISMRDEFGCVYFANLVTKRTRWFPPHLWMDGWVSRSDCVQDGHLERCDIFDRYSRKLLPPLESRLCVEGGAPYLHSYGLPRYSRDGADTADTFPI